MGGFLKGASTLDVSDSVGPGWDSMTGMCKKLPSNADTSGQGITPLNPQFHRTAIFQGIKYLRVN